MVSFIQSNYLGFGSGIVIKEKGIALHNRGAGLSQIPSIPILLALKKPFHTIIPGIVLESGRPLMAFGMMGGPMRLKATCNYWIESLPINLTHNQPVMRHGGRLLKKER